MVNEFRIQMNDRKFKLRQHKVLQHYDEEYKDKAEDFDKFKANVGASLSKLKMRPKNSSDSLMRKDTSTPLLQEFKSLRKMFISRKPFRKISRKLIDHNDVSFDQVKENTNQKLIEVLTEAKRKKNLTQLAHIMNVAHKPSPYKEKGLYSLGSLLFNNVDGSTSGEFGDTINDNINYK